MERRRWQQIIFNFADAATLSDVKFLGDGAFGTLFVPSGLNGKTLQMLTEISGSEYSVGITTPANFDGVALLSTAKTLATGKNAFDSTELTEVGAAGPVRLSLSSAVSGAQQAVLWWKS